MPHAIAPIDNPTVVVAEHDGISAKGKSAHPTVAPATPAEADVATSRTGRSSLSRDETSAATADAGRSSRSPFRSLSRSRGENESRSRSASRVRGLSRIRETIKEIVEDPFWKKSEQDDEIRDLSPTNSTSIPPSTSGSRAPSRSGSRAGRSPLAGGQSGSRPSSRSQSRVRAVIDTLAGMGGGNVPYGRTVDDVAPREPVPALGRGAEESSATEERRGRQ
ncbi:hypothetical protein Rhopal_007644-T1 [Rhodotorula paludigena]|uniref:Uncharacterized protein n=1 Tax=Rhodotorula paludigena TaxID=86838 RepID=A0AAV5GPP6_9BASI|nr:hypothetical protein Rhopal_007644-T1 [Rhodotorula paludigena]